MRKIKHVCVLGGTGFVGHAVVRLLIKQGYRVRVPTRRREKHRDLLVLPNVELVESDVFAKNELQNQFSGMDAVINLIGILNEGGKQDQKFQTVHARLARMVADACNAKHVPRLLHMGALKSDANRGTSKYLRSKGEGENIVHTTKDLKVTTFKPSVIYGQNDSFLTRFASIVKLTPAFLPIPLACAEAKFAPVHVEDVAFCMVASLEKKATFGQRYELCGPEHYSLKEIVQYIAGVTGKKRRILSLGPGLSQLQASLLSVLPGHILTSDNILSMRTDSVCDKPFPSVFGITPNSMNTIAPTFLTDQYARGKYSLFRRRTARN